MGLHDHCTPNLSEADSARLEALLEARRAAGAMGIDTAHGFLTAVVSGPRLILPVEWLPRVLGGARAAEDEPQVRDLLGALYRDVLHELEHGHYGPLVAHRSNPDGPALPLPYGWCRGYAVGLNLHGEDAIDAVAADPEARRRLETIAAFLAVDEAERLAPADALGAAAVALYRYWHGAGQRVP